MGGGGDHILLLTSAAEFRHLPNLFCLRIASTSWTCCASPTLCYSRWGKALQTRNKQHKPLLGHCAFGNRHNERHCSTKHWSSFGHFRNLRSIHSPHWRALPLLGPPPHLSSHPFSLWLPQNSTFSSLHEAKWWALSSSEHQLHTHFE